MAEDRPFPSTQERERSAAVAKEEVNEAIAMLEDHLNAMSSRAGLDIANEVHRMHPTLSGQLVKAMALGIVQHVMRDEDYKGGWPGRLAYTECTEAAAGGLHSHPVHDGRWNCHFVVGCFEATLQWFV
jgi:hypothetical protein